MSFFHLSVLGVRGVCWKRSSTSCSVPRFVSFRNRACAWRAPRTCPGSRDSFFFSPCVAFLCQSGSFCRRVLWSTHLCHLQSDVRPTGCVFLLNVVVFISRNSAWIFFLCHLPLVNFFQYFACSYNNCSLFYSPCL